MFKVQFKKEVLSKVEFENQGLKVQVSNLKKGENVCTTLISSFKTCVRRFRTQWDEWNGGVNVKLLRRVHLLKSYRR